jgi:hypothetical protein
VGSIKRLTNKFVNEGERFVPTKVAHSPKDALLLFRKLKEITIVSVRWGAYNRGAPTNLPVSQDPQ